MPANTPRLYVDPETLCSLEVPPGWLVDTSGQQGTKVLLLHPGAGTGFRANVNLSVQDMPNLTAEEFLTLSRLQLQPVVTGARLEVDKPAGRADGGHWLGWSMQLGPETVCGRQLLVVAGGKAYVVTAMSRAADFEACQAAFEATLASFRIPPPSTA